MERFLLPVSNTFAVDARAPIAEVFVAQLNNILSGTRVGPEHGGTIDGEFVRGMVDFLRPGVLPKGVLVELTDVRVEPSGYLVLALRLGSVADGDQSLDTRLPDEAVEGDEARSLAVLVTKRLPPDVAQQLAGSSGGGSHAALTAATAKAMEAGMRLKVDAAFQGDPGPVIGVRAGDLSAWPKVMRERLDKSLKVSGTLTLNAEAMQLAIAGGVKGVKLTGPSAGGELKATLQNGQVVWSSQGLRFAAQSAARDRMRLSNLLIVTNQLTARSDPAGGGVDAGEASGEISATVEGAPRPVRIKKAHFTTRSAGGVAAPVVTVRLTKIEAEIDLGELPAIPIGAGLGGVSVQGWAPHRERHDRRRQEPFAGRTPARRRGRVTQTGRCHEPCGQGGREGCRCCKGHQGWRE